MQAAKLRFLIQSRKSPEIFQFQDFLAGISGIKPQTLEYHSSGLTVHRQVPPVPAEEDGRHVFEPAIHPQPFRILLVSAILPWFPPDRNSGGAFRRKKGKES